MNRRIDIKLLDLLSKANILLFPYIWTVSLLLIFFESILYEGFVRKYFFINEKLLVVLIVFLGVLVKLTLEAKPLYAKGNIKDVYKFLLILAKLSLPLSILIFYLFSFEKTPFSRFHTNPGTFIQIPILLLFLLFLQIRVDKTDSIKKTSINVSSFGYLVIPSLLIWVLLRGVLSSWVYIKTNVSTIIRNPLATYEWKMEKQLGPIVEYYQFVNNNTPKNAVILHPTQQGRWPDISNEGFTRYFLYPRNLVAQEDLPQKANQINYVFIIGRFNGLHHLEDSWPDFKVPAKRVIYFSPESSQSAIIVPGNFDPDTNPYPDYWGIIEVSGKIQ